MAAPGQYPDQLRERAIRLARESDRPLAHIARDLGWADTRRRAISQRNGSGR